VVKFCHFACLTLIHCCLLTFHCIFLAHHIFPAFFVQKFCLLTYKCLQGRAPEYLSTFPEVFQYLKFLSSLSSVKRAALFKCQLEVLKPQSMIELFFSVCYLCKLVCKFISTWLCIINARASLTMCTFISIWQVEQAVMPYLAAFASFRENIRQIGRSQKGTVTYCYCCLCLHWCGW